MDTLVRKAYGYHGNRARKRMRFPRRHVLSRIIRLEQERVLSGEAGVDLESLSTTANSVEAPRPLALASSSSSSQEHSRLLASTDSRSHLAAWLPLSLRLSKLELIYSTNIHGRTLERFYTHCKGHRQTVTVVQVLDEDAVVGMFANQEWHISSQVYGDGECLLFRISPDAACFQWKPSASPDDNNATNGDDLEDANSVALLEQFQVGRPNFISMGGNPDGTCGLRLNEDLTRGESAPALGFGNSDSLVPGLSSFDVGLVEVYRLKQFGEDF